MVFDVLVVAIAILLLVPCIWLMVKGLGSFSDWLGKIKSDSDKTRRLDRELADISARVYDLEVSEEKRRK